MKSILLSAALTTYDDTQNLTAHRQLKEALRDRFLLVGQMNTVYGRYAGTDELSFRVTEVSDDLANDLARLAFDEFGQESVLIVDSNGEAYLRYRNGYIKLLGTWLEVDEISGLDAYSEIGDKYYVVK